MGTQLYKVTSFAPSFNLGRVKPFIFTYGAKEKCTPHSNKLTISAQLPDKIIAFYGLSCSIWYNQLQNS